MKKMVKVYDQGTKKLSVIPQSELGHGMTEGCVQGVGTVWIQRSQLKTTKAPFCHPPLSEKMKHVIEEKIMEPLSEVRPLTLREWEDGFRRDLNAEEEIAVWCVIAERFKLFVESHQLSKAQRQEVFMVMLRCTQVPSREAFWETFQPQSITREHVEAAIAPFERNWCGGQEMEVELERKFGDKLDEARRAIAGAEVVIAKKSGEEGPCKCLFGRREIERIRESGGMTTNALQFTYEDEADLRLIRYLVELVKGFPEE
jgi:hypothetical protein